MRYLPGKIVGAVKPPTVSRRAGRGSGGIARGVALVAFLASVGLGVAACTSGADTAVSAGSTSAADAIEQPAGVALSGDGVAPDASSSSSVVESPALDEGDGSPSESVAEPLPNTVSGPPAKVSRPGQPDQPAVVVGSVGFSAPAEYDDKTVLAITGASKEVESGNGPGVFNGREFVKFELALTNGSDQPIDLNSVVVTAYYGDTNQIAAPVYTASAETQDFTGTVAPGAQSTASYGFAVPTSDLGNVTMVVDFDAVHSSATFSGAVSLS